jgi:hypothetical protein
MRDPYCPRDARKKERDARVAVVNAADQLKISQRLSNASFCKRYNLGNLEVVSPSGAVVKRLSVSSLCRWRAAVKAGAADRLGFERGAARRGSAVLATAEGGRVRLRILALIAEKSPLSASAVRRRIASEFPDFQAPPLRTFQHFMKGLRVASALGGHASCKVSV